MTREPSELRLHFVDLRTQLVVRRTKCDVLGGRFEPRRIVPDSRVAVSKRRRLRLGYIVREGVPRGADTWPGIRIGRDGKDDALAAVEGLGTRSTLFPTKDGG